MKDDRGLAIIGELVSRHSLSPQERAQVEIESRVRGGIGGRGFGRNCEGIEVGWWIHPDRYRKELDIVQRHLNLQGTERILTLGCGPAFHEIALALMYPRTTILATDFDAREVETAYNLAGVAGASNIDFRVFDASEASVTSIVDFKPSFDRVMSLAALHDVPAVGQTFATVEQLLVPTGLFLFTYNPGRRRAQFPNESPLEELLAKHLVLTYAGSVITPNDSLGYYGDLEMRSRRERGYGIVQDLRVARPRQGQEPIGSPGGYK